MAAEQTDGEGRQKRITQNQTNAFCPLPWTTSRICSVTMRLVLAFRSQSRGFHLLAGFKNTGPAGVAGCGSFGCLHGGYINASVILDRGQFGQGG